MKTPKTPQEKKLLSYTKDHRKLPGTGVVPPRAVSSAKHKAEKGARRREEQVLRSAVLVTKADDALVDVEGRVREVMAHKTPVDSAKEVALSKVVEVKQRARAAKGMGHRKFSRLEPR